MSQTVGVESLSSALLVPVNQLARSPRNPRRSVDLGGLSGLAESMKVHGVLEPLIVRPLGDGYEVVCGNRRLEAAVLAGLDRVPVVCRALSDAEALQVALIENAQREDVSPLEEAEAFRALEEAGVAVAEMAAMVGLSTSVVYRRLRLLDLPADMQAALYCGRLSLAHAEKLCRLSPALIEAAIEAGVVWDERPLFEADHVPGREDLAPLHRLEAFIQMRSAFDPTSEAAPHYQPALAQELAHMAEVEEVDPDPASLVELSLDPMVRSRLGADPKAKVPLSPSKWREVARDAFCDHTQRGVITHGGASRVIDVCITRSCAQHFPPAPKAKKAADPSASRDAWDEQRAKDAAKREAFGRLKAALAPQVAAWTAGAVLSVALVRRVLGAAGVTEVAQLFGVKLTDETAVQVLELAQIGLWHEDQFASDVRKLGFDFKAAKAAHLATEAAARRLEVKAKRATKTGSKKVAAGAKKKAKASGQKAARS